MVLPANSNQNTASTPAEGGSEERQGYVTKEEFEAFGENLKTLLGKNFQAVQSQTDRYQDNVQKEINKFEQALKALSAQGVNVSAQQADAAKAKIMLETLTKEPPADQTEEELPENLVSAYQETVTAGATQLMEALGVTIEDEDPEVEIIEKASEGPVPEYFKAVRDAITAKKARLEKQGKPNLGALPNLSAGSGPSSNAIQNIMDPAALWEAAREAGKIR